MRILLIQGANMEYLGRREPELYGTTTAAELDALLVEAHPEDTLDIRYTNIEGEAIGWIYQAERDGVDGLLMNPAGFHYGGHSLRDCVRAVSMPFVEVHMTNIDRRGMRSVTATEAGAVIHGMGVQSYMLGMIAMRMLVERRRGLGPAAPRP
jgi:3-dehydroquinate dehydratase II